jgi:hypothetical protein
LTIETASLNRQPRSNRPAQVSTKILGASARSLTGLVMTAPAMNTVNTFDKRGRKAHAVYWNTGARGTNNFELAAEISRRIRGSISCGSNFGSGRWD